ncbi:MAG: glucoamylase family protein [Bacillota bacterium]
MSITSKLSPGIKKEIAATSEQKKKEIKALLKLDSEQLLNQIQKKTFNYFWQEADQNTGLVKDRYSRDSFCSIAATGFALTAIPVAVERGWIDEDLGFQRVLTTLQSFLNRVEGKNGFYYHFVDGQSGKRSRNCELSSIDTSLLLAGIIFVGQYYAGTEVQKLADELYAGIDWPWMLNGGQTLCMGWKPESGFGQARWSHFDEGLLAYILAIGSPTHPLAPDSWHTVERPVSRDRIYLPSEPLFVYQYPQIWVDFRNKEDDYTNYWENTGKAIQHNYNFTREREDKYDTYSRKIWGLSACDGPEGYRAYGAAEGNHDGTIAPYAAIGSLPYNSELAFNFIDSALKLYGPLIWGKYGFTSGFNADREWFSRDYIGIDQGTIFLMIENYRTGMVWDYFMQNRNIQQALAKIGFKERVDVR